MASFHESGNSQQIKMKTEYEQTIENKRKRDSKEKVRYELFFNACGGASYVLKCLLFDGVCVLCALSN